MYPAAAVNVKLLTMSDVVQLKVTDVVTAVNPDVAGIDTVYVPSGTTNRTWPSVVPPVPSPVVALATSVPDCDRVTVRPESPVPRHPLTLITQPQQHPHPKPN